MLHVVVSWSCVSQCGEHGQGPTADKDAERHTTKVGHATVTSATPAPRP